MKTPQPNLVAVATTVQRLSVLLGAGVTPAAAWGYLPEPLPVEVSARVAAGAIIPDAVAVAADLHASGQEVTAWRGLAAAWAVAADAGAPLAGSLRDFAESLRGLAQAQRDIAVALAAPRATARLVLILPLVGILFGAVLGFNTIGALLTTAPGWVCLLFGSGLMVASWAWSRRLVARAAPDNLTPGLAFDLVAIAVSGGGSPTRARARASEALERFGVTANGELSDVDETLELSARAGIPAAELLRSEARECRRTAMARAQAGAQSLSVRLMVPLGVCVLPAFMALSVAPLLIAVLGHTGIGE